jgi:hypothetical protein
MKKYLLSALLLCVLAIPAFAQDEYTWEDYDLQFTLPANFELTASSGEEFTAEGEGMSFSIIPFDNESIDASDITSYTIEIAASLGLDGIDDVDLIDINGFAGGYVEGNQDGVTLFMMGLIDPDSDTNFFVIIAFEEGDENAIDLAIDICRSIQKM